MRSKYWTYQPISNPKYSNNQVSNRGIENMINQPPFCIMEDGRKQRYVCIEVSGKIALFSSPQHDSRHCVSTRIPSPSAIRGIFCSIFFSKKVPVEIIPTKVEICSLGDQVYLTYNYNGDQQQRQNFEAGIPSQYRHTVYTDVCYKLWARIENLEKTSEGHNPKHLYQSYFFRNLYNYKFISVPFLGLKRYTTDYFGPLRNTTYPIKQSFVENTLLDKHWTKFIGGKSYIGKNPEKVETVAVEVNNGIGYFE